MDTLQITALVALVGAATASIVSVITARTAGKKSDVDRLTTSFAVVEASFTAEIKRVNETNDHLTKALTERRAEIEELSQRLTNNRLSCEAQIAELTKLVTTLTAKLPEPGSIQPVQIVGTTGPLDVAVVKPVTIPVELVAPIPLLTTAAEVIKAIQESKDKE